MLRLALDTFMILIILKNILKCAKLSVCDPVYCVLLTSERGMELLCLCCWKKGGDNEETSTYQIMKNLLGIEL